MCTVHVHETGIQISRLYLFYLSVLIAGMHISGYPQSALNCFTYHYITFQPRLNLKVSNRRIEWYSFIIVITVTYLTRFVFFITGGKSIKRNEQLQLPLQQTQSKKITKSSNKFCDNRLKL